MQKVLEVRAACVASQAPQGSAVFRSTTAGAAQQWERKMDARKKNGLQLLSTEWNVLSLEIAVREL